MKKILLLGLFLIVSFSFAQAVYGTKNSFFKSNFCKKYKCELTKSVFSKDEGLTGGVWYIDYKITIPGLITKIDISTHRDSNNVMIPSASVYFPDVNVHQGDETRLAMLSDFVFTLVGKRIKPADFAFKCADDLYYRKNYIIMAQGKTDAKPPNKPVPYVLYCEMLFGDKVDTYTDDSINFVIADDYHPR